MSAPAACRASDGTVGNAAFENLIARHGLRDFDHLMQLADGMVIKHAIAQRKTVRLQLPENGAIYLKRHYPAGFFSALKKIFSPEPTAFDEYAAITAFHEKWLPTVIPVAAGKRRAGLLQTESFLVTLALEGCTRLDDYLSQPLSRKEKQELINQMALLIQKMHAAGFNHRDLYLCHILRDNSGKLHIIDLHRAQHRTEIPARWLVKDLAALNYSAPAGIISRSDRLRFLKTYLGASRLTGADKRFALKILKKSQKMLEHNTKKHCAI